MESVLQRAEGVKQVVNYSVLVWRWVSAVFASSARFTLLFSQYHSSSCLGLESFVDGRFGVSDMQAE